MHVMPGESLAHLLPAALWVALRLPAVDASGGSSDSEEGEAEDGRGGYRHRWRDQGEEGAGGDFQATRVREGRWGMMVSRRKPI